MATDNGVKLLDFWMSPFGQRCRIALAEKGVEYEYQEENLQAKSELLLKSNPVHKKIPVLIHGGKPVCESLNILQYIDEVWPGKTSFLPADPFDKANALFWADYVDKKVYEWGRLWKTEGEAHREAKKEFVEILKTLETELGDKKYFAGDVNFGIVDIALVPFTSWFYTYEAYSGIRIAEESPKLVAWAERCKGRDSVAKTLYDPAKVYEHMSNLIKSFGGK